MLENLTDRMSQAIRNICGLGTLTEDNIADALSEVRTALLSADVHFKVARDFIEQVKSECLGQEVAKSVAPGQQVVKVINDQLITLLGEGSTELASDKPLRIMLVGLHGSGKTTSSVKLAYSLKKKGYSPSLVACDVYRPAAIDQLIALADKENFPVFADPVSTNVPKIGKQALSWAKEHNSDAIIFDTAGRLQIDKDLVRELVDLKNKIQPHEILLVADSALGQEAVNVAKHFHEAISLTGIVLTKLDGDARGGAALSMKAITGVPIKLIGTGEKPDNLETFHPDRLVRRILGMGDVVSLVEKAQESMDKEESERLAKKVQRADFNFEDLLSQMQQMKKMGSISSLASMLPGMHKSSVGEKEENQVKHSEAIILSMTPKERRNPRVLNGSRRLRIAKGAGVQVKEINSIIKQLEQMRKFMKSMKGSKGKRMQKQLAAKGADLGNLKDLAGLKF